MRLRIGFLYWEGSQWKKSCPSKASAAPSTPTLAESKCDFVGSLDNLPQQC